MAPFDLRSFKGIFFDIYATLIDWESGIYPQLLKLSQKLPAGDPRRDDTPETRKTLLQMYAANEKIVEHDNPTLAYPKILESVYDRIAAALGVPDAADDADRVAFGKSIGEWPAFPDTVEAMKVLAKHYKLFVLSNVDNESFGRTLAGPLKGVHWDGIYTAEQIGSYKPNPRNYEYVVNKLKTDFGISKDETLMVAQNLDIDHASAKALGFRPAVWIARYAGNAAMGGDREELEAKGLIDLGAAYETLGEMAEAVERAFA
ncbi:haloacid dehalogenase, type II [Exophiala oligosperma]|uniref:Haloacid dehalogenase, type II n=1 Tax=Exophiala oligosperma TaxID=215243 RepID=A0A0D2D511_9EURO|nr:haloacid dehalogenase, type II [Exophiala oligosperma]KIW38298.1 haloacid dehalogenase, type II [Exophiala oligosperma]